MNDEDAPTEKRKLQLNGPESEKNGVLVSRIMLASAILSSLLAVVGMIVIPFGTVLENVGRRNADIGTYALIIFPAVTFILYNQVRKGATENRTKSDDAKTSIAMLNTGAVLSCLIASALIWGQLVFLHSFAEVAGLRWLVLWHDNHKFEPCVILLGPNSVWTWRNCRYRRHQLRFARVSTWFVWGHIRAPLVEEMNQIEDLQAQKHWFSKEDMSVWDGRLEKGWRRRSSHSICGASYLYDSFLMNPWLNTLDRQGWQCEVEYAQPVNGGNGFRGGGATPHVVVKTKNCGKINIEGKTVDPESPELTAAKFEPDSQWIFEIGWYSRNIGVPIERRSPSSQEYHKLGE